MQSQNRKPDLTPLILGILILQVILLAGLLIRINQVYHWVAESKAAANVQEDISLVNNVSPDDDPFKGTTNAPVTIVEFSDFSCVHCRQAQDTLDQVMGHFKDQVRVVFRDFPLEGPGSLSFIAALAGECADEQGKFWAMHDKLFNNQPVLDKGSVRNYAVGLDLDIDQFDECLESERYQGEILRDVEDGRSYGVSATPTFFVNGRRLVGTVSFSTFQRIIEGEIGR